MTTCCGQLADTLSIACPANTSKDVLVTLTKSGRKQPLAGAAITLTVYRERTRSETLFAKSSATPGDVAVAADGYSATIAILPADTAALARGTYYVELVIAWLPAKRFVSFGPFNVQ